MCIKVEDELHQQLDVHNLIFSKYLAFICIQTFIIFRLTYLIYVAALKFSVSS